ncbi:MAG: hypothetical protein IPM17_19155 [Verrucomicrobia bacterium]|nr:hypothetical protein [Verrucomicrobiota bacterium]
MPLSLSNPISALLLTVLVVCQLRPVSARTAEDSFHFRNMSSEPPGEAVCQDLHPQLAVTGSLVHLAWISQLPDQAGERLMYRRSTDGGVTFGPAQVLLTVGNTSSLSDGLQAQDAETGGYPAYLAADGQEVHLALKLSQQSGADQILYLRSSDGGASFAAPQVWATVTINPPEPAAGRGHTAALRPPMVTAAEGRVVIAFGYTAARAYYETTPGFDGWVYGYWEELSVSWSANGGASFQPSALHGTLPTDRHAAPSHLTIQGSEVLLGARYSVGAGWGAQATRVVAGISADGGANFHFQQLTSEATRPYSNNLVRMVKQADQAIAFFVTGDESHPALETLYQCRSTDGGATWSAPQRLTEAPHALFGSLELGAAGFSVAANGPEILVAAAYSGPDAPAGRIAVRRSTDGGATYAPWQALADGRDPRSNLLQPLHWPRFALWPGAPGEARAALLWGGNHLVTSDDSGASFGPALMVRPPAGVLPNPGSPYAPQLVTGTDGTLHLTVSSVSRTDPNEWDVYYRRFPATPDPTIAHQALALGSNLPPQGDVSAPRHRDSLQVGAAPGLAAGEAFTIEFWVRYQGTAADRELFTTGPDAGELSLTTGTTLEGINRFRLQLRTAEGYYDAVGTTVEPQPGRWYHVALRYDANRTSGQLALLVDGQPDVVADAAGSRVGTAHPFVFGNDHWASAHDFIGEIDEIRFWNIALPDETIRARRSVRLTGNETGLAAWFPLDGNTRDATGNLPDGMLVCRETFVPGVLLDTRPTVPPGVVSWWPAEGDFRDRRGVNHATGAGGVGFGAGMVGRAFRCDGNNDYVQVSSPTGLPLGNAPRTLMLWCRTPRNLAEATESALVQYGSDADGRMFGLITSGNAPGKLYFFGYNADLAGGTALRPDTWYHLAVAYDGTTVRLFVNGQLDGSAARSLNTTLNASGLTIGNRPGSSLWQGELDEVMLFNRALAPEEIAMIHAAGADGLHHDDEDPGGQPARPQLTVSRNGKHLELAWTSEIGFLYQLQVSTSLREDDWTDYESPLPGNGQLLNASLLIGPEPAKFVRLKIPR